MLKIKRNFRSSRAKLGLVLAAAAVLPLASAVAPMSVSADSNQEAVLISAAGNVVGPAGGPIVELAAVYYHGWYTTKEACQSALRTKLATGMYWGGGCSYYNQYPHKNTWQLWLDEKSCMDRLDPTTISATSSLQTRSLLAA